MVDEPDVAEDEDASRVAASGECGGGLGAVAPAVGDDGPQQVLLLAPAVPELEVDEALALFLDGASPTTSISSSSSRTSTMTWGGGGGDGVGLDVGVAVGGSSTRSGHG